MEQTSLKSELDQEACVQHESKQESGIRNLVQSLSVQMRHMDLVDILSLMGAVTLVVMWLKHLLVGPML